MRGSKVIPTMGLSGRGAGEGAQRAQQNCQRGTSPLRSKIYRRHVDFNEEQADLYVRDQLCAPCGLFRVPRDCEAPQKGVIAMRIYWILPNRDQEDDFLASDGEKTIPFREVLDPKLRPDGFAHGVPAELL